jgi:hypothetical protein
MRYLLVVLALCLAVPVFAAPDVPDSPPAMGLIAAGNALAVADLTVHRPWVAALAGPSAEVSVEPIAVTGSVSQAIPEPYDIVAFGALVLDAFGAKNYGLLAALALILLVWLARRFGSGFWPFLSTDRGGALTSLIGGLGLAIAAAATAPEAAGLGAVLLSGLLMTVTASGTYSLLRKLLYPSGAESAQEVDVKQAAVEAARPKDAGSVADRINAGLGR